MRRIRLTSAVKMDNPYLVGDMNAELTVHDATAEFAIRQKLAEYVGPPAEVGPTRAELEAQEAARIGTLKRLDDGQTYSDPYTGAISSNAEDREIAEEDDPDNLAEPKRPYGNAPKSAWADYAVKMSGIKGCPVITIERAEEMSKADLMSRYGARLGEED